MTFDPNIPQATDLLSVSQGNIQTNFNQSNIVMGVNHVNFNNSLPVGSIAADRGKHTQVTMIAGVPTATGPTEGQIYTNLSGGTRYYSYFRRESSLVDIPFSMVGGFAHIIGATGLVAGTAFNLTSAKTAQGRYTVSFTRHMSDANYVACIAIQVNDAISVWSATAGTYTAANFTIKVKAFNDTFQDPTSLNVIVFGEIS